MKPTHTISYRHNTKLLFADYLTTRPPIYGHWKAGMDYCWFSHVPHYFYLAGFKHVCLIFKRILDDEHIRHRGLKPPTKYSCSKSSEIFGGARGLK